MIEFLIENTTDPNRISFLVTGVYKFRVGVRRSGSTDTITSADMSLLLVLICFLAGLLARAAIARRVVDGARSQRALESSCLRAAEDQDPEHAEP
jgi:hypothetical protein